MILDSSHKERKSTRISKTVDIAIVGGGASSAAELKELVHCADFKGTICTISPKPFATSEAFSSPFSALTNTPVHNNSLTAENPSEFHQFLATQGWPYGLHDFTPRWLVDQYIRSESQHATSQLLGRHHHLVGTITDLVRAGDQRWSLHGTHGSIKADNVVLAGGLGPPKQSIPKVFHGRHISGSDGTNQRLNTLARESSRARPLLVLGTKLSAIDIALSVLDHRVVGP